MFEFSAAPASLATKKIALTAAAVVLGGSLGGYAIHEHNTARDLAAKNQQATTQLNDTQKELSDLATKVNMLVASGVTQPAPAPQAAPAARLTPRPSAARPAAAVRHDDRYKKMQAQLDAQGKAIQDTQSDLVNTRNVLTGSIAHTHEELVLLQKKGERNYAEFDISKSKEFQHKGPLSIRLKKANVKHQYADLEMIVDDRNLSQKHINLYQPAMFYTPDSPQPVEIVINSISKDHIHGYVSSSKYGKSELASMQAANDAASSQNPNANPDSGIVTAAAQPERKKLTVNPQ